MFHVKHRHPLSLCPAPGTPPAGREVDMAARGVDMAAREVDMSAAGGG